MSSIQQKIQSLLDQLVKEGEERGAQVAAYHEGDLIVDASAGVADSCSGKPVTGETLFPVFSVTKGLVATMAHMLVEQGHLEYETRLAEVWPEFGVNGKSEITLRQALNHTAGLANMPMGIGRQELGDWEAMCRAIADLQPTSVPGTETVYHAITYGWIVGETMRRVDGRPFAKMLDEMICQPLGITSIFVGLPESRDSDVAFLESALEESVLPPIDTPQAVPAWVQPLHTWMNRADARRACIPASNGIMNARAVAKHYAALVPGGMDGVELLPPKRLQLALEISDPEPSSRSMGYILGGFTSTEAFGHGGFGGSHAFADPKNRFSFAFVRNRRGDGKSYQRIADEFLKAGFGSE